MKTLDFRPTISSPHYQTIVSAFRDPGEAPYSTVREFELEDGDCLSCHISRPDHWQEDGKTLILVHGLGGSHASHYMVRLARKLYQAGHQVVRVNLRGAGSGANLAKLPYNAGTSGDLLELVQQLKNQLPKTTLSLVGFSLGANIVLKLAGELGLKANGLISCFYAVCPPLDLKQAVQAIQKRRNYIYHAYYIKKLCDQATRWLVGKKRIASLYEFDDTITAPLWGYQNADDYYEQCSAKNFLSAVRKRCHILVAKDDPFVPFMPEHFQSLPEVVQVFATLRGGHMGFLSRSVQDSFWLDQQLLDWIETE